MKTISVRQPWAWLIVNGFKDIENRDWPTKVRGRVLIHASKGMTHGEYDDAVDTARMVKRAGGMVGLDTFPSFNSLQRGGIVGSVEIVDCVSDSPSPWFFGNYGFVLANAELLPFREYKGQLGFFEVQDQMRGADSE